MSAVIVVGTQWGDEGKGKIVDLLAPNAQHIVRSQGGNNAGHTILLDKEEYKLHLIPSGILHPHTRCYISAGVVIDPEVLVFELNTLESRGIQTKERLFISPAAHIIFPYHRKLDLILEQKKGTRAVKTTGRGIGPCYADKAHRLGIRIAELMQPSLFATLLKENLLLKNEEFSKLYDTEPFSYEEIFSDYTRYAQFLAPYLAPVEEMLHKAIEKKETILLEGAQGTFLDISLGTYPFVTSCSTLAGGIAAGAGIGPSQIAHTLGVIKAYTTRVGAGPFPSEVVKEEPFLDHLTAREFGTTTLRKRRIGWFDTVLARTAVQWNGLDSLAITKLDVLDSLETIQICVAYEIEGKRVETIPYLVEDMEKLKPIYETLPGWKQNISSTTRFEDLPAEAITYLKRLETLIGIPFSLVSIGPERSQSLILNNPLTALKGFL